MVGVGLRFPPTAAVAAALCAVAWSGPSLDRPLVGGPQSNACLRDAGPVDVHITPKRGPVGTRVRITGRCFARRWNSGYGIFLRRQFAGPRECEIIAGGAFRFRVSRARVGRGWFEVAHDGACFQHRYRRRVTPGRYRVGFGCHACAVARFRVTR
jgi:hypothetical protein